VALVTTTYKRKEAQGKVKFECVIKYVSNQQKCYSFFSFHNYISRFIVMVPFVSVLAVTSLSLHISKIILYNFLMTVIKHAHKATLSIYSVATTTFNYYKTGTS